MGHFGWTHRCTEPLQRCSVRARDHRGLRPAPAAAPVESRLCTPLHRATRPAVQDWAASHSCRPAEHRYWPWDWWMTGNCWLTHKTCAAVTAVPSGASAREAWSTAIPANSPYESHRSDEARRRPLHLRAEQNKSCGGFIVVIRSLFQSGRIGVVIVGKDESGGSITHFAERLMFGTMVLQHPAITFSNQSTDTLTIPLSSDQHC